MVHLLSALIVGSVYGGGYALRGKKLPLYKVSVVMLSLLLIGAVAGFLLEDSMYVALGHANWSIFSYARQVVVYSLWLQSLICIALSVASFMNARRLRYIAGGVLFTAIFLFIAYATSTQALALTMR